MTNNKKTELNELNEDELNLVLGGLYRIPDSNLDVKPLYGAPPRPTDKTRAN
jgi:bacteriocin-like protein